MIKNLSYLKSILFALVLLSFLSGCGDDLSRGKAEALIKDGLPPDVRELRVAFVYGKIYDKKGVLSKSQLAQLKQAGVIIDGAFTYLLGEPAKEFMSSEEMEIMEDNEIHKIQVDVLTFASMNHVEIKSISKPADKFGKKVCEAQYEIKYKPNELGKLIKLEPEKLTRQTSALFVLMDNGWMLDSTHENAGN